MPARKEVKRSEECDNRRGHHSSQKFTAGEEGEAEGGG